MQNKTKMNGLGMRRKGDGMRIFYDLCESKEFVLVIVICWRIQRKLKIKSQTFLKCLFFLGSTSNLI